MNIIILIIYTLWTYEYCLYMPILIDLWIHCATETEAAAHVQYISCPTVWLGGENEFGVDNGFITGDWISINLFDFV